MFGIAAPLLPDIYVPTFAMKVDDMPLDTPTAMQVMEIRVTKGLDAPNSFSFCINDPTLALIDQQSGHFTEGTKIEIAMGYVGNTKSLIVGEITAVTADIPSDGPATVEIQGFDLAHRLQRGTVHRLWGGPGPNDGKADSDVVTEIAGQLGLSAVVDTTSPRSRPIVQSNVDDLSFIKELARLNNFYLWVDGTTLYFAKQLPDGGPVTLERGKTLMSFTGRLSTAGQVMSAEVRGWDPSQKQDFSATVQRTDTAALSAKGRKQLSTGSGGKSNMLVINATVESAQEAQTCAQSIITGQQQSLFSGSGVSVGYPDIVVGATIALDGIARFDGTYVVQQVTHSLEFAGLSDVL